MKNFYAIFVAAIFAAIACPLSAADDSNKNCQTFNVCTFNLRYPGKNDGPKNDGTCVWEKRCDLVKAFMLYRDIDIMGTQELYLHQINDLLKLEEYDFVGTAVDPKSDKTNNAIFFRKDRFEVLAKGTFWFSETPDEPSKGWDAMLVRNTNWAKFRDKHSNKEFFVFNSHFDHKGGIAKRESASLLARKIKEIAADAHFFSMGDFNSNPESETVAEIDKVEFMKNSFVVSKTAPYGPKFTNNYGWTGKGRDWIDWIDYIYIDENTEVLKFAVICEIINGVHLSDHYPIVIKCELK